MGEKKERAIAEAVAAKEEARQAALDEAQWAAGTDPAAAAAPSLRVVISTKTVPTTTKTVPRNESIVEQAVRASKPVVKRKPIELVNKWGATPVYVSPLVADDQVAEEEDEEEAEDEEPQGEEEAADEEAVDEEAADEEETAAEDATGEETVPEEEVPEEDAAEAVEEAKPVMSANPSLAESMKSGIKKTAAGPAP